MAVDTKQTPPYGQEVDNSSSLFLTSLAKGLAVIRSFNRQHSDMSLKEMAELNQMSMGSAQRIAHTLEKMQILVRDQRSKRYRLGVGALAYAWQYLQTEALLERANSTLLELSQYFGETVNLHVPCGTDMVLVGRVQSRHHIPIFLPLGQRLPLYCTASGRAVLSLVGSQEEMLRQLGPTPRKKYTDNTITTDKALLKEIAQAKTAGYSFSNGEYFIGDLNLAAPILDEQGKAIAALNLSIPAERWSPEEAQEKLAPMLIRSARALSYGL